MLQTVPAAASESAQIEYKWVAIGDMFLPPCQENRALDEAHVEDIVANWNDAAFGTPMMSYREHGNRGPRGEAFGIVSGQHRIEAARRVGKVRVYCAVVHGLDLAGEARLFINEDKRKRQSALGKFHLSRRAGDAEAVAIWEVANGHGFIIAKTDGDKSMRSLRCVTALTKAYRRGNLSAVLGVLAAAFGHDPKAAGSQIIDGLSVALRYRSGMDHKRLSARLSAVGYEAISQRFRAVLTAFNGEGGVVMANTIIGAYNTNLRTDNQVALITTNETKNTTAALATDGYLIAAEVRKGKTLAEARAEVAAARAAVNA